MRIVLVGSGSELEALSSATKQALETLSVSEFVSVTETNDEAYKAELGITENPALCVEEETIEFKDMIFEGVVPAQEELVSMFASIFGVSAGGCDTGGCGSDDGSGCGTGGCGSCGGH